MSGDMDLRKLSDKFPAEDIEWRVQSAGMGNRGPWTRIIPYITNRAIMQRLDDICGMGNWKNEYTPSPCNKGYLCGISILINGNWVTRWDGAETSGNGGIDPVKSTLSNSMKRAGVQWGIGRYLYRFEAEWAECELCDNPFDLAEGFTFQKVKGKNGGSDFGIAWKPKPLPAWALPSSPAMVREFIQAMKDAKTMEELKRAYKYAYNHAESEQDDELRNTFENEKEEAKFNLEYEEALKEDQELEQAIQASRDSIKIIRQCKNESALTGQLDIAIRLAEVIKVAGIQRKVKITINDAAKKRRAELQEENNGN